MLNNRVIISCFLVLITCSLFGQARKPLEIIVQDKASSFMDKRHNSKKEYAGKEQVNKSLQQLLIGLYNDGYLSASFDSVEDLENKYVAWLFVGQQFNWIELSAGNVATNVRNEVSYKQRQFTNQVFNLNDLDKLLTDMLAYCENNGYPFAQISLDSLAIIENGIKGALNLQLNQLIVYDTINIIGEAKVSKKYLYSYLGLKPGKPYSEQDILRISKRIVKLPFLNETQPLTVNFVAGRAIINLYLADNNASQFDFLLGILPNNAISGRVLITGELNLQMVSPFGTGKEIGLQWRRLQVGSQNLDMHFNYPYLFSLPLGTDLMFSLYKRDTSYLDVEYRIGLEYLFVGKNYLRAFVHNEITNVLNVDTNQIKANRKLLNFNDVRNVLYGLEYNYQQLDHLFNPRQGFQITALAGVGTRKIKVNNAIANLNDPESTDGTFAVLYDSLKLNRVQYRFMLDVKKFVPIKKRSTWLTGVKLGAFVSDEIFLNEQFRIGGTKILRGFDEESIFASLYVVGTLEYRFLLSKGSFFSLFFDAGYVETRTLSSYRNDWPIGFGAGLNFETKAGMFGVSYAIGRQQQNKIDIKSAKIHFGYFNYF